MSNVAKRERPRRRRGTGKTRGTACRGGRQHRGLCSRQSAERWLEATDLSPLTPPAPSATEPLFVRIPQELSTNPGVMTHVICGHIVQESSEPFECGLTAQPNAEPGPSSVTANPRQEESLVNRNSRTAFDSRNATPLRISDVTRASPCGSATSTATSTVAAKPTSTLNTPPPPPLLAPCVAITRENPASTVICVCGGHQPAAAPDDALVREEGDALAASAPCPPCRHLCAGERAIADGARTRRSLREMASQVSPPGPSRLARAPTEKSADEWTVEDVVRYVKRIPGCARHAEKFRKEEVDGEALLLLRKKHLIVYMGLPVGPAVKILRATRELRMRQHPN
ncbi:hypothetical protein MRX96_059448 [Rhipicephalus microplus]